MRGILLVGALWVGAFAPLCSANTVATEAEPSRSRMEGMTFDTTARASYFRSSKALDDEVDFFGATVQPKLQAQPTESIGAYLEARAIAPDIARDRYRDDVDARILQAYAAFRSENTDLRIGQQIVAWGRADGINPTDNLTPRDYRVMLPLEEDQRFGTPALKVDRFLSDTLTLSTFITPFFSPSKIPSVTGGYAVDVERPARTLGNTEVGVRLDRTGSVFDGSISFYHGYSLLPNYRVAASSATLIEYYDEMNVLGVDMARNFDRFGVRAEIAYSRPERKGYPGMRYAQWFYVLGADRTFAETTSINLQFVGRYIEGFRDAASVSDPALAGTALLNAIINNQQSRTSYGISSRIGDRWRNDTVTAEVLLYVGLTRSETYLRPLIAYALDDRTRVTVGAEIYRGSDESFFGRLANNSGPFIELRYSF